MTTVSSSFIYESQTKKPLVTREFTIASSDYSGRVMKWPIFRNEWDCIRPVNLQLELANADKGLNFVRENKAELMAVDCNVNIGLQTAITSISDLEYANDSVSTGIGTPTGVEFSPDGLTAFVLGVTTTNALQFSLSEAYTLTSATLSKTLSLATVDVSPRDLCFNSDGSKLYILGDSSNSVYRLSCPTPYDLGGATKDTGQVFSVATEDLTPRGLFISPNDDKFFVAGRTNGKIFEYTFTGGDLTTAAYTTVSLTISTYPSISGLAFNTLGTLAFTSSPDAILGGNIVEINLSSAWDLSTATQGSVMNVTSLDKYPSGVHITRNNLYLVFVGTFVDYLHKFNSNEKLSLFTGNISAVKYSKERCTLTIVNKFQKLSDRQIGTSDVPISYTGSNYLPSDIAWWAVTSYGGYSNISSTSNPDIDYNSFLEWAGVFSGDSVYINANFDGQKVTEVLRKISRQTNSAIYVENDKLYFRRFGTMDAIVYSVGPSQITDATLTFASNGITNKQYVSGGYDPTSNYHTFTVFDQSTASVNSFGLKENTIKDDSLWYVNSGSAINLAQRLVISDAQPDDDIQVDLGLMGVSIMIGETIYVEDAFHDIQDSYRARSKEVNLDSLKTSFTVDRTMILDGFILDVTSLGGTEVLT